MTKIKNLINKNNILICLIIVAAILVIAPSVFLYVSYDTEKGRYKYIEKHESNFFSTQYEYELDNQEHELVFDDLELTELESVKNNYKAYNGCYKREIVGNKVFKADRVKTETFTVRTTISQNKFNEYKYVDTKITVSCVDTTLPKWVNTVDSITVKQGESVDIMKYFSAVDNSGDVKITSTAIDTNKVGSQNIEVQATDVNGNVAKKNIVVNVVKAVDKVTETEQTTQASKTETTTKKPQTTTKSSTTTQKQTTTKKSSTTQASKPKETTTNKSQTTNKKPQTTTKPTTTAPAKHDHSEINGNMGKWFNSRAELNDYYNNVVSGWNTKAQNGSITMEEYYKNCPYGYECWSCPVCHKWTGNFYYR